MAKKNAEVTFDYQAEADNQLSIKVGEKITIIGNATPENWILAQTSNGKQGYIPNDYFKITGGPPPRPGPPPTGSFGETRMGSDSHDSVHDTKHTVNSNKQNLNNSGGVFGPEATLNVFTHQLEWYTISLCGMGGVMTLMYGTVEPNPYGAIIWTAGVLTLLLSAPTAYLLARYRESLDCCGSGALGRSLLFFVLGLLFLAGYPVSLSVATLCFITSYFNWLLHYRELKSLPNHYDDNWCNNIFGGMDHCTAGKLTSFFLWLAFDFACFAWGFIDGYDRAINITDDTKTSYYINPTTYGVALGFGRIVTINLFLLFIYACYGCLDRRTAALQASRRQDSCCGKCHLFIAEKERRQYVHRLLSYPIVWGSLLHVVANFFAYEDSGSTRSYRFAFGYETIITGNVLIVILGIIVASSNELIREYNPDLFRNSHLFSLLFALLTIFHGTLGTNDTTAIAFIACGIAIYLIDWLMRCGGKSGYK